MFSYILRASGFVGLAAGFGIEFYIALLRDPILYEGAHSIPSWLSAISVPLLIGSVAVLIYGVVLNEIFKGWVDLVTICALGGQWGVPLGIYLSASTGAGNPIALLVPVGYGLHALAAIAVAVAYLRRGKGIVS
ncbi:hypothetical protein [Natronococcus sp. A-GB7]|uniref:hypothetical protein n=1 Tax=Natronococcus sp. A-GB7 TaxID=3037649 RepID=UPI00241FD1D7|nr:hypothetical protein [Natronococcus sp. A-GB7]MDG5821808.1 hypothetical protein [Natronococcus sp. A-GB7]